MEHRTGREQLTGRLYHQDEFRQAAGAEFRPGGLALTDELLLACGLDRGDSVLDLACGVGSTASHLAGRELMVTGLDDSPDLLAEAQRRRPGVAWTVGEAESLPFAGGRFDAVFAECFLSTLEDASAAVREVRRVLRPGGRLAVSDVYLRNPEAGRISFAPGVSCLRYATGKDGVLALLKRNGLSVRLWEDRSEALKTFTASLILAYGSAAEFWTASGAGTQVQALMDQVSSARPGYYILVATKD